MRVDNFLVYASTTIAPTGATAATALPVVTGGSRGPSVLVQNIGTVLVYCAFGDSTVAATTNSTALQVGCAMVFDLGDGDVNAPPVNTMTGATYIALLVASGTGSINVATGVGS